MRYKKEIPLSILKVIDPILSRQSRHFTVSGNSGPSCILRLEDMDKKSKFFFQINKFQREPAKQFLEISFKPKNEHSVDTKFARIELASLPKYIDSWEHLIAEFDEIKALDDSILKQYEEEFYSSFEILDEDADVRSFDLNTQLRLSEFLDYCLVKIQESKTGDTQQEAEVIKNEIVELKDRQSKLSKRLVIEKLSKILARIRKMAIPLIRDVWETGKKETIKYLVKHGLDQMNF